MKHTANAMTHHRPRVERRQGAAAVELAVLLPLLVFLFLVTVDFCRVFYATQIVENSARSGALFAAKVYNESAWRGNIDTIEKAVRAEASNLNQKLLVVTSASTSSEVAVTVDYTFTTLTNFPGIPTSLKISRTVRMTPVP